MVGTHSEPRRGQMSHICNISALRVKTIDDISTEKDISNLQPPISSRMQRSLNISSIKKYLEESIDTDFNKHQLTDFTNKRLTIDMNDLNCD